MAHEYKTGDRVRSTGKCSKVPKDQLGTVKHLDPTMALIEWEKRFDGGHSGGGYGKDGHCRWMGQDQIEPTHKYHVGDSVTQTEYSGADINVVTIIKLTTYAGKPAYRANAPQSDDPAFRWLVNEDRITGLATKPAAPATPEEKPAFKVGDTVRVTETARGSIEDAYIGKTTTVTSLTNMDMHLQVDPKPLGLDGYGYYLIAPKYVEVVEPKPDTFEAKYFLTYTYTYTDGIASWPFTVLQTDETSTSIKPDNMKGTPQMSSSTNLINAKLSADERYARTNGLKNADGTVTTEGMRVMNQWLWNTNEKAIIKDLKAADKAIREAAAADAAELAADPQ